MRLRQLFERIQQWVNTRMGWTSECYHCGLIVAPYRGYDMMCCGSCEAEYRYEEWKQEEWLERMKNKVDY